MYKKIVQRVPVQSSLEGNFATPEDDLGALIDLVEIELDLSTGNKSLRTRLSDVAIRLNGSEGAVAQETLDVLLDAVGRLEKIERYMRDLGFETARDSSGD